MKVRDATRLLHMGCGEPLGCRLRLLLPRRPQLALVLNCQPPRKPRPERAR